MMPLSRVRLVMPPVAEVAAGVEQVLPLLTLKHEMMSLSRVPLVMPPVAEVAAGVREMPPLLTLTPETVSIEVVEFDRQLSRGP
jgi:hypothetical protein